MPSFDGFKCEVCDTLKKETNHWWLGKVATNVKGPSCALVIHGVSWPANSGVAIVVWQPEIAKQCVQLCGLECASKWMMRELSKITQL